MSGLEILWWAVVASGVVVWTLGHPWASRLLFDWRFPGNWTQCGPNRAGSLVIPARFLRGRLRPKDRELDGGGRRSLGTRRRSRDGFLLATSGRSAHEYRRCCHRPDLGAFPVVTGILMHSLSWRSRTQHRIEIRPPRYIRKHVLRTRLLLVPVPLGDGVVLRRANSLTAKIAK